jgi:hypothetical protein
VGIAFRAVDQDYPRQKVPKEIRFDTWGTWGIFNPAALEGPALYLCESPIDALSMIMGGFLTAASLAGTKGLRWQWLSQVQELCLCGDLDSEGMKAAQSLASQAVLHGLRVYLPGPGAYNGYGEPSEQWEREGRVTLRICCGLPVHPPTAQRCPTCLAPMCSEYKVCDPDCPILTTITQTPMPSSQLTRDIPDLILKLRRELIWLGEHHEKFINGDPTAITNKEFSRVWFDWDELERRLRQLGYTNMCIFGPANQCPEAVPVRCSWCFLTES